jgi:polygalacturonase
MRPSRRVFLRGAGALAGSAIAAGALPMSSTADPEHAAWREAGRILARVRPPRFPHRTFRITDFGARGDDVTDCTAAIREAIARCHHAGGGRVVVPDGAYLTGAIHLRGNVNLHLEAGATLRFSQDPAAYLPAVFTRWQGIELMNYSAFIYAFEQENIAISGSGTLDGQADATHWWPWKTTQDPDWQDLQRQADAGGRWRNGSSAGGCCGRTWCSSTAAATSSSRTSRSSTRRCGRSTRCSAATSPCRASR